jgi:hypothetical protein
MRLAGKCLGYVPVNLRMQRAATEVRLWFVAARQLEARGAEEPGPMAAPFLVTPASKRHGPVASKPRRLVPCGSMCPNRTRKTQPSMTPFKPKMRT